jgi:drug/metabolite transporter (DMT)-like permease
MAGRVGGPWATTSRDATMPSATSGFWRRFNVALRLLGVAAILGGIAVIVTTDMESDDALLGAIAGGAVCLVGIAFMAGRPFRPDLGDATYVLNPFGHPEPRHWFTGDRKADGG